MDISEEVLTLLYKRIGEWNTVLVGRNETYFTFKNPAGWRRHYFIFKPIESKKLTVSFDAKWNTFVATYYFEQDHFITTNYKTEEQALACQEFFKRNTDLHRHQAIYLENDWHVLDRCLVMKDQPDQRTYACERIDRKEGKVLCLNDYYCRENNEIGLLLKTKTHLDPLEVVVSDVEESESPQQFLEVFMHFILYDVAHDSAKSVTIELELKYNSTISGKSYRGNSVVRFMETSGVVKFKKPVKTTLKKTLLMMLKSALYHTRIALESKIGGTVQGDVFSEKSERLDVLFSKAWESLSIDYV